MALYAFELGRKKNLCLAELLSMFGKEKLVDRNLNTAIFDLKIKNSQNLQNLLGGSIKIIKLWETGPKINQDAILKKIQEKLISQFQSHSGKIPFSISTLSFKDPKEYNIKKLLNFSKKILKSLGLNSRFVNKNFQNTRPSTIYKARVLEKGMDINVIKGEKQLYLGQTVAIQNIDTYSIRDYEKPCRDARAGMIPPKLAQVMINLAGPNTQTIYDPFCGTGTILMEGILMGKTVVGSDIEPKMVEYSEKNIQWIIDKFGLEKFNFKLFTKDSRFLVKENLTEKIDAIITEGYLGKPISRLPSDIEIEKTFRELANLHLNWLRAVHTATPKHCKVVMCLTTFKGPKSLIRFPKFEQLAETAGWKIVNSLLYDRPNQIVAREIKVLEKIKKTHHFTIIPATSCNSSENGNLSTK